MSPYDPRVQSRPLRALPALLVALLASACASPRLRRNHEPVNSGRSIPSPDVRQANSGSPLHEQAFFNLAPLSLPAERPEYSALHPIIRDIPSPYALQPAVKSGTGPAIQAAMPSLSDAPEEALIWELSRRWECKWAEMERAGDRINGDAVDRWSTLRDGLAIGLLRPDHGADELIGSIATLASSMAAPDDLRLLAAAYLAHHGGMHAAKEAAAGVFEVTGADPSPLSAVGTVFRIEGLSFARSIEGPGKFIPASVDEIVPGRKALLYGELRGFRNEPEGLKGVGSTYRRSFSGLLRLLNGAGKEVDRLEFLPEARGLQRSQSEAEVTNFWAKYNLPADLSPDTYRIIIDANDLLGRSSATAELTFEVPPPREGNRTTR